jgi:hypothetical protein
VTEEKFSNVDLSEAVILGLCPDASNPNFRQIQKIVMTSAQDTGLIWVFLGLSFYKNIFSAFMTKRPNKLGRFQTSIILPEYGTPFRCPLLGKLPAFPANISKAEKTYQGQTVVYFASSFVMKNQVK